MGEFVGNALLEGLCDCFRRLFGIARSERASELPDPNAYVPPKAAPAPRAQREREATRQRIRERVAARRARDGRGA